MPRNQTVPVDRALSDLSYARRQLKLSLLNFSNSQRARDCVMRASDALDRVDGLLTDHVVANAAQDAGDGDCRPCEHSWHRYGTINGLPDIACQNCGVTQKTA